MKKGLLVILFSLLFTLVFAADVDTIQVASKKMNKSFKCVVIKPSSAKLDANKKFPVTYLLHGYSGWYANWIIRVPDLKLMADQYNMFIVCPEGQNSWYLDSPLADSSQFETYISTEVPAFIDSHYPTIQDRKGRAITGLSMGGHGGLYLGFKHSEVFGACGSMSGGVDIRPFKSSWEIPKLIGDSLHYAENWEKYSVINLVNTKPTDSLAIIIDCGTEDFFYKVNCSLHEKLLDLKINHDFISRPGKHDWNYWRNAVQYQLLFFNNYFNKK